MLTPLSAKKRENAHFCFTSCSFFVEPVSKNVALFEICPAHPWIRVDHTVRHPSATPPSKTPLFDGFELPHARTPPKGVAIPGSIVEVRIEPPVEPLVEAHIEPCVEPLVEPRIEPCIEPRWSSRRSSRASSRWSSRRSRRDVLLFGCVCRVTPPRVIHTALTTVLLFLP